MKRSVNFDSTRARSSHAIWLGRGNAVDVRSSLPMTRWRQPSLRHSAFDEVQLAAVASWASIRSQVLAPHARSNHRQSQGRIASDALRALALFVEHTLPYVGQEHDTLSPIEADTGGDGPSMLSRFPEEWSILLILRNYLTA